MLNKKFFLILSACITAIAASATTFTFTSADAQTKDGFTVKVDKGSGNNAPAVYNESLRLYAQNTITITGGNITKISLSFTKQGSKAYADLTASAGTLVSGGTSSSDTDIKTDTWTGSASSVTFTLGASGQRVIKQIVINGEGSEDNTGEPNEPDEPDTPGTLDPDYNYDEPTIVTPGTQTVQGDAYNFISNNIEVSCTKGALNADYFSTHAGYAMTFTATKPIKGIVINGFVKTGFTAKSSSGDISYITPSQDKEANAVVVVKNVNSKFVTISCEKQLRCYNVEVYFNDNPEIEAGDPTSEENLLFDTAEAVYESEYSQWVGIDNYSLFLFNADSPAFPYFAFDLYPTGDTLEGKYSFSDYTLDYYTYYTWGENDGETTWGEDGEITIVKNGDNYTVSGYVICDNSTRYNISFTGAIPVYLDSDYYYGDDDDDDDNEQGGVSDITADKTVPTLNSDADMYDLHGRKVNGRYRGVVIQNGHKHILK